MVIILDEFFTGGAAAGAAAAAASVSVAVAAAIPMLAANTPRRDAFVSIFVVIIISAFAGAERLAQLCNNLKLKL